MKKLIPIMLASVFMLSAASAVYADNLSPTMPNPPATTPMNPSMSNPAPLTSAPVVNSPNSMNAPLDRQCVLPNSNMSVSVNRDVTNNDPNMIRDTSVAKDASAPRDVNVVTPVPKC